MPGKILLQDDFNLTKALVLEVNARGLTRIEKAQSRRDLDRSYENPGWLPLDHQSQGQQLQDHQPQNQPLPPLMQIVSWSSGEMWNEDIDIHNSDWMVHMGKTCRAAFAEHDYLPDRMIDVWGPEPLSNDRIILYITTLDVGVPRQAFPGFLAWAMNDLSHLNLSQNQWEIFRRGGAPWLRTQAYSFGGWTNLDHAIPDIMVYITVIPRSELYFVKETLTHSAMSSWRDAIRSGRKIVRQLGHSELMLAFGRGWDMRPAQTL